MKRIKKIDPVNLHGVDLNLLPVFLALMADRSTTLAARRLGLGQPAVSAALRRLRETLDDELFERVPSGLEPTARAHELHHRLLPALHTIGAAIASREAFDPSKYAGVIRLVMTDNHEHFLMPRLIARLREEAPGLRIVVRPAMKSLYSKMLDQGEVDLVCGVHCGDGIEAPPNWQTVEVLLKIGFRTLYNPRITGIGKKLTLAKYLELPHLLMSQNGDLEGVVDDRLSQIKKRRNVIFATTHFASLPAILKELPAIATLPELSALRFAREYGLASAPVPLALPKYDSLLIWLAARDRDPPHMWFREVLKSTLKQLADEAAKLVS